MTTPESQAAALLGRKGGRSKSPAKQNAARENGRKGGRAVESDQTLKLADYYEHLADLGKAPITNRKRAAKLRAKVKASL